MAAVIVCSIMGGMCCCCCLWFLLVSRRRRSNDEEEKVEVEEEIIEKQLQNAEGNASVDMSTIEAMIMFDEEQGSSQPISAFREQLSEREYNADQTEGYAGQGEGNGEVEGDIEIMTSTTQLQDVMILKPSNDQELII